MNDFWLVKDHEKKFGKGACVYLNITETSAG